MTSARVALPAGNTVAFRRALTTLSQFEVTDVGEHQVSVAPQEGAGVVRQYLGARKVADSATVLGDEAWSFLATRGPYLTDPNISLPPELEAQLHGAAEEVTASAVAQRLSVEVSRSPVEAIPRLFERELPHLFARYPNGSLWHVSVEDALLKRLTFMRIALQLSLTPDLQFDPSNTDGVSYFGVHSLTAGVSFVEAAQPLLLMFSPTACGFAMNSPPHAFVFLFGELVDLRAHGPGPLARRYYPTVNNSLAVPGIRFPTETLHTAHVEALLQWWTSRLNILYSHAADPTRFVTSAGQHDPATQAGWFFTFERLMADTEALAASVDSPGLLRMQGAFDALDKAAGLLTVSGGSEPKAFKRLLRREEALPRLHASFGQLPLQLRARFRTWASRSFEDLYSDIASQTMASRKRDGGVLVGHDGPDDLRLMTWDDYVPELLREARNASHGLVNMLTKEPRKGRARRLLLATNSGDVPASFYELTRAIVWGLLADAAALCRGSW